MKKSETRWMLLFKFVAYIACYLVLALLSRSLSFPGNFAAVWLPAGFALAVFAYTSKKSWWLWGIASILSGVIYNGYIQDKEPVVTFGFMLANVSRTLLGATILQWRLPGRFRLDQPSEIAVFTIGGCLISPILSGAIGSLTLLFAYGNPWYESFPSWYFGNVVGIMVVSPLTLVLIGWANGRNQFRCKDLVGSRCNFAYLFLLLGLLAGISIVIFRFISVPVSFLVAPVMLWMVVRFEIVGAAMGSFVVAIVMLTCTSQGYGAMGEDISNSTRTIVSQVFLTTVGVCALVLSAALQRSRRLTRRSQQTGRRLANLQRETQLMLDTIPSMVFYKDRNNRILRLNRSAAAWMGMLIEEIQGKSTEEIHPGPHGQYLYDDQEVIRTGVAKIGYEESVVLPSGERRWVQTDKMPLPSAGRKEPGVLVVLTDITERKLIEEELEKSNQDLEQFAVIASHDLKEPLRAVNGYCRFLKEDFADQLPTEALDFVDKAIEGADRMTQMVNDLLEYSRISRGNFELNLVDLNLIVAEVLKDLDGTIKLKSASVKTTALPVVSGSESQLRQLFQNLFINSLKFVADGIQPQIEVSSSTRGRCIVVTISDNGLGIDPKDQKRIFQIFQRLHRRADYPGTGLGLAISDRIMQRHGGQIEVESALGNGATFRLVFPSPS
ncbi:MASE1 domain-containing protein [Neorhodopirellula pilleata]|nr:MASE1 domain-containing protein [Neorhodopirellula pilleata]